MRSSSLSNQSICFIGAGSMAEALIRGILHNQLLPPEQVTVVNRHNEQRLIELKHEYNIKTYLEPEAKNDAIAAANLLVLAMKPKDVAGALKEIGSLVSDKQLIISVIAGLSIASLTNMLQTTAPIVRTMPNTSSSIGLGATGISFSSQVSEAQKAVATAIFESVGMVAEVEEEQLDIVTGLSGSGPAYIYYIIEALTRAGIEGGLRAETSQELAVQTVLGAATMVRQTKQEPAQLRQKVTSPGGTTQAALELLAEEKMSDILVNAVHRSAQRARELGNMQ